MPLSIEGVCGRSVPNEDHATVEVAIGREFPAQLCAQLFDIRQGVRWYTALVPVAGPLSDCFEERFAAGESQILHIGSARVRAAAPDEDSAVGVSLLAAR